MAPTYLEDVMFGAANEDKCQPLLERHLNESLTKTSRYCAFDFHNPNKTTWIELKSRRIASDEITHAQLSAHKLLHCDDPTKTYYISFWYDSDEALYIIKYDKALFKTFGRQTNFYRSARDGDRTRPTTMILIPMSEMTLVQFPKEKTQTDV